MSAWSWINFTLSIGSRGGHTMKNDWILSSVPSHQEAIIWCTKVVHSLTRLALHCQRKTILFNLFPPFQPRLPRHQTSTVAFSHSFPRLNAEALCCSCTFIWYFMEIIRSLVADVDLSECGFSNRRDKRPQCQALESPNATISIKSPFLGHFLVSLAQVLYVLKSCTESK